ncbi:MAG TPA: alpha/beta hydrolase-fold protein, partial [Elusimicrobiota bacterium]|nr:alpha/beta hydrolase-fold protein [Elusimicrobiota bacterium]
ASAQIVTLPSAVGSSLGGAAASIQAPSIQAPVLTPALTLSAPALSSPLQAPSAPIFSAPPAAENAFRGDVRIIRDFRSQILGNSRSIAVYLPPGYESSNERYPVLYVQDGQNLFDAVAEQGRSWGLDETCERLMRSGELPPFIIVGVYNTLNRIPEYTPVPDDEYGGGNGELYGQFLIKELKPYIDANLRTLPGPESTGLMGSSLGALISLHVGLDHPDVFSRIGALSPSLWWANAELTRRLGSAPPPESRARVWVDMGTREGDHPDQRVAETLDFGRMLQARGWRTGSNLSVRVIDGAGHNEGAWRARAAEVLKFLFPSRRPTGPRPALRPRPGPGFGP